MKTYFDEVAKAVGSDLSRRQALWRIWGIMAGATLGSFGATKRAMADTLANCNSYCQRFPVLSQFLTCRTACLNCPSTSMLCGATAASLTCCSVANGTGACVSNSCTIQSCNAGFADCNHSFADGCEANLATDPNNCGACGFVCSGNNMAVRACTASVCTGTCNAGFANCDNNFGANGCETNISTDPNNCGGCGVFCSGNNMASRTCGGGVCNGTCAAGFANCNGNLRADGCETNISNNVTNCGACGFVCSSNNSTPTCVSGSCFPVCNFGFANCDGNPSNGCETNIASDPFNCGSCGHACAAGHACVNGNCI